MQEVLKAALTMSYGTQEHESENTRPKMNFQLPYLLSI